MNLNFEQIKLIPADINNTFHCKGVWNVKNQNLEYNLITNETIPYEDHCRWWAEAFENEFLFIIIYKSEVFGYIRLTKLKTIRKDKYEISIALTKKIQNMGIGSYIFDLFEKKMKQIKIPKIIALTHIENEKGQKFFEKNNFKKISINNEYIKYVKKL